MKEDEPFDCVEMKHRIQQDLREEYERRKNEFASYADFINKTAFQDETIRAFIDKAKVFRHAA